MEILKGSRDHAGAVADFWNASAQDQNSWRQDRREGRVVRPTGFEPVTLGSEDRCAIQLRHGRVVE